MISPKPQWSFRFLRWYCHPAYEEDVAGDLEEVLQERETEMGSHLARWLLFRDVLVLFRPEIIGFSHFTNFLNQIAMFRNYLILAFRNFRRQFGFSFINVSGLAIGMAAFMIILSYVSFELSYDDYLIQKEKLYRLNVRVYDLDGELFFNAATAPPAFKGLIENNMPEVERVARLYHCPKSKPYINIAHIDEENIQISFNEEHVFFADAAFLTMFDIHMLAGDTSALNEPNTVILSESAAKRYFGHVSDDIIGQMLKVPYPVTNKSPYQITGIFQDLPPNTHLQTDMLLSYRTLSEIDPAQYDDHWRNPFMYIYIQFHSQVTEQQFTQTKHRYEQLANERYLSEDTHNSFIYKFDYEPVRDLHLHSSKAHEIKPNGNAQIVYFLLIISFLVIIIAWVNYVNLTTAKAVRRAKEVGVRKVAGASRSQLIIQFLAEAFLINLLAILIALIIIWVSLPFFSQLMGKPLTFSLWWEGLPDRSLYFMVVGVMFLCSTLLSGLYPALVLSSFQPLKALKGRFMDSPSQGISLRAGLVVVQFTMSVILMAGTYLMFRQMEYMQNKFLGFEKNQMLIINSPSDTLLKAEPLEVFKNEILEQTFVQDVALSSIIPGREIQWVGGVTRPEVLSHPLGRYISIDHEFMDTYGFTFLAGRNFSEDYGTDEDAILLNETLANLLFDSVEAALHQKVNVHTLGEREVVGVVKDYHQSSLKESYYPICFILEGVTSKYNKETWSNNDNDRSYISVKIKTSHIKENIELLENKFKTYFPGFPFEYSFLDERFNQQYKADIQFGKIFSIFASLAIFIACLGIFGLSSFMALQKSKEIGIRKVLGATVSSIVLLLSSKFMRLVSIASIIALPLAYFIFDRWLENYAFRIDIGWWFFVVPVLAVFMIAIFTISVQTIKAAMANPVDSLKYE